MTFSYSLSKTTFVLCATLTTILSSASAFTTVTTCDAPLGPIREHWDLASYCYESDTEPCCGPLQNFTTCVDVGNDLLPDVWKNGVCSGYTIFDCCFQENGDVYWNYTDCPDGQVPLDYVWYERVNGTSICIGTSQSSCCTEVYKYTSCPPYYQKKTTVGAWSNGVCYGSSDYDCCDYVGPSYNNDDYWITPNSDSSTSLSLVAWILIAVAICIVPCVCGCCCKRCGWYDKICRHPTVVKTRKAWKTVSNVASTVENITKSAANVTDVASTLAGGGDEEQTTVVIVAVESSSSDCDATSEHDEEEP